MELLYITCTLFIHHIYLNQRRYHICKYARFIKVGSHGYTVYSERTARRKVVIVSWQAVKDGDVTILHQLTETAHLVPSHNSEYYLGRIYTIVYCWRKNLQLTTVNEHVLKNGVKGRMIHIRTT